MLSPQPQEPLTVHPEALAPLQRLTFLSLKRQRLAVGAAADLLLRLPTSLQRLDMRESL